jgi:hypothetical protein
MVLRGNIIQEIKIANGFQKEKDVNGMENKVIKAKLQIKRVVNAEEALKKQIKNHKVVMKLYFPYR